MALHSIIIDSYIEERIKEFNEKLPENMRIENIHSNKTHVFIVTALKEKPSPHKNLLKEEFLKINK